jgi:hypothetical protein
MMPVWQRLPNLSLAFDLYPSPAALVSAPMVWQRSPDTVGKVVTLSLCMSPVHLYFIVHHLRDLSKNVQAEFDVFYMYLQTNLICSSS